jgi:hypothetical protein
MISPIKKLNRIANNAPVSVANKAINTPAKAKK